jgi:hypothetical protein
MSKIVRDIEAIKTLSAKVLLDLKRRRLSKAKKHLGNIIAFDVEELSVLRRKNGDQAVIDECLIVLRNAKQALNDIDNFENLGEAKKLVQKIGAIEEKELSNIRLRAHHIGKIAQYHLSPELLEMSNAKFLAEMHEVMRKNPHYPDDFYSDEWFLGMRDIFKKLMNDPTIKFKYVTGPDSLCTLCHHRKECTKINHEYHKIANRHDANEAKEHPELKRGRSYDINFMLQIYKKKGWIK